MRPSHLPLRLTTGAFILNSGLGKRALAPEAAAGLQNMAARAFPFVTALSPPTFGKLLSAAEIGVGAALLAPVVPPALAGAALTAFAGGLLTMYVRTPGVHEPGSIRPTQDGIALAKDSWLLGTGLALVIDGLGDGRTRECRCSKGSEESDQLSIDDRP